MNYMRLKKIKSLYFGYEELSRVLGITLESARVVAVRYVKNGMLVRVKRNLYMTRERFEALSAKELFLIANLAQTPSYVSFMSALSYYELSTQVQSRFVESIAINRTATIDVEDTCFVYFKIDKSLYNGFSRVDDMFIASKEKALLDALYFKTLGLYNLDVSSIDFKEFDRKVLDKLVAMLPVSIKRRIDLNEYF